MIDLCRRWATVEDRFRLSHTEEHDKKGRTLRFEAMRVSVGWFEDAAWGNEEPGFSVVRAMFTVDANGHYRIRQEPLAFVGLHAAARWYERSRKRDLANLLLDASVLVDAAPGEQWPCSTGWWLGRTEEMRLLFDDGLKFPSTVHNVRTFIDG